MVQALVTSSSNNNLVWRTPFPYPDSPSTVGSRANSWNARDEIVRRFSEPALDSQKEASDKYIKSAIGAYHDAVAKLQQTLKKDELDMILSPSSTVAELHKTALGIQREQSNVLDKRKLAKFIDVIDHYSGVFDVLAQCDFSYMTLLWGGLKFGLIMSKNHHDMLYRFTDMMVDIGLNLARIELYRQVFPTGRMLELVSELYAAILEFLQEVIMYLQKKTLRKYFASFAKPFDLQFGRLVERIRRLQQCIEDDARAGALVMQLVQHRSIAKHRVDSYLRRNHFETALKDIHEGQVTPLFLEIKKTLFHGFEIEASYHEELATTFKLTSSPAWAYWLSIEQQYVPSRFSHETTIVQAECDAPDAATCLQWVAQARAESPHVVSTFLLWARGMTAQSAIASILFQMLQQRPQALSSAGLTMRSFAAANLSLPKLWSLFLHLVRTVGGLMVYISIGSVGTEEFDIVQRFVDLCQKWDGPPINVILIHPWNENFARTEDCVDIDDKYDVHPSLTCSDAVHHVILLVLDVHEQLSDTVQMVLWEALWREVRYAVIGIAANQVADEIKSCAESLIAEKDDIEDQVAALWTATVVRWVKNKRVFNSLREQIQRHLSLVEIHLPEDVKTRIEQKATQVISDCMTTAQRDQVAESLRNGNSKPLEDPQRDAMWEHIQAAVRPGTHEMFSTSIRSLMSQTLDAYLEDPPETEREARTFLQDLQKQQFGWSGRWKRTFVNVRDPIIEGAVAAIGIGFADVVDAIKESTLG